jgi:hypothetical protein
MKGHMKTRLMTGAIIMAGLLLGGTAAQARDMLLGVEFNGAIHWIDPATGAATQIATGPAGMNSLATDSSGRMVSVAQNKLWEINPLTGAATFVVNVSADIRGLAFSPAGVLHGIREGGSQDSLVIINQASGAVTVVGGTGLSRLQALDFAPNGTLYGIDLAAGLVRINTSTGQATDVNASVGGGAQALAITPAGAAYRGTVSDIHLIDLQTGVSTLIGGSGYNDLRGLGVFELPDVPPSGSLAGAAPNILWPPNNKPRPVSICGNASAGSAPIASAILVVDDEYGVVTGALDITGLLDAGGDFCANVPLIASRDGNDADGRLYAVTLMVTDANGLTSDPVTTFVLVPHDLGKGR